MLRENHMNRLLEILVHQTLLFSAAVLLLGAILVLRIPARTVNR